MALQLDRGGRDGARSDHRYTPTAGLPELRRAIADKTLRDSGFSVEPSQVLVTNGGKQAAETVPGAIIHPTRQPVMA